MKDNPANLQHPMEKEAFITMVEDAIKDVLADEEIVEYMSDLITKRLLMLMKEKAFQKIVENVVDQVVEDLRQVMSKQVQSFIKERINIGFMGNGDMDSKNVAAGQQEDNKDAAGKETNVAEEFDKGMTLFVNEKELSKQTLNKIKNNVTYDHAEVDFCAESAKAKLKDKKRIDKHVVNLVTETVLDKDQLGKKQDDQHRADDTLGESAGGGKQSEKKKTVEDLKKLMNIMEEVVQTSMGGYVDEEIMEAIKNVAHKDEEINKVLTKNGNQTKRSVAKNTDMKYSLNRKTPKDKNSNQYAEKQEYSHKMPVVEEESGGEPACTDSDEDLGEDGLNIQELLRLKRIINAMGKCGE